jgi:hypothetical protein
MLAGGMPELLEHSPFQTAAVEGEWSPRIPWPPLDGYRPSFNTNDSLPTSPYTQPPSPAAFAEPQSAPDSPYQEGGQPQELTALATAVNALPPEYMENPDIHLLPVQHPPAASHPQRHCKNIGKHPGLASESDSTPDGTSEESQSSPEYNPNG